MAVREFDGVDDFITLSLGNCASLGGGAVTVAAIVKITQMDGPPFFLGGGGLGTRLTLNPFSSQWQAATHLDFFVNVVPISNPGDLNQWRLIAFTKASGTVAPRGHEFEFDTSTWSHANAGSTLPNATTTASVMYLGRLFQDSGVADFLPGRLAVVGVWDSALTDTQIETLETALQNWVDLSPVGLWALNQASVATPVEDLTVGNADQTAITGTTVITGDDPPGFNFTLGGGASRPLLRPSRRNIGTLLHL